MALKDFDTAFTNKVKAWYSNTIYANTALVYNVAYNLVDDDATKEALRFPLISIYRPSGFTQAPNQTFAARKRGLEFAYDEIEFQYGLARFLVVNLPYQLDIYTKTPETLDDITEHVMQAFNLDQKLEVAQHDDDTGKDYTEAYDITYSSGPSELSEFSNDDRIYHYSLLYEIKGARLVNFKNVNAIKEYDAETGEGGLEYLINVEGTGEDPDDI